MLVPINPIRMILPSLSEKPEGLLGPGRLATLVVPAERSGEPALKVPSA